MAAVPQSPLTPRRARHPLLTAVPCQTCHSQRARGERAGEVAPSAQPSWCRLGALDTLGNISPARRRRRSRRGGEGNTSGSFGRERRMQKRRLLLEVLAVLLDSSIKQCIAAAGGCQEGKFGTDRCSQGGGGGGGGGWAPPASSRKEIGSKNSVLALPTIRFLLSACASEFYISQIYTERAGFLPCPIQ